MGPRCGTLAGDPISPAMLIADIDAAAAVPVFTIIQNLAAAQDVLTDERYFPGPMMVKIIALGALDRLGYSVRISSGQVTVMPKDLTGVFPPPPEAKP